MRVQIILTEDDGSELLRGEWKVSSVQIHRDRPPEIVSDYGFCERDGVITPANLIITTEGSA